MASFLIQRGANLGLQSDFGYTALHTACLKGDINIVRDLITKGASLSLKDDSMFS